MAFLELIIAARSKASMLTTSTPRSLRSSLGALWQRNRSSSRCKPLQPQAGAFARRPYLHAGLENVSGLPYFLSLSVRDQPAADAVSKLNGKLTDTRSASHHSNITLVHLSTLTTLLPGMRTFLTPALAVFRMDLLDRHH